MEKDKKQIEPLTKTEDWRTELARGRTILVAKLADMNWSYSERTSKVKEINDQIDKIDKLLQGE